VCDAEMGSFKEGFFMPSRMEGWGERMGKTSPPLPPEIPPPFSDLHSSHSHVPSKIVDEKIEDQHLHGN
jgi:hypothetical protein